MKTKYPVCADSIPNNVDTMLFFKKVRASDVGSWRVTLYSFNFKSHLTSGSFFQLPKDVQHDNLRNSRWTIMFFIGCWGQISEGGLLR